MDKHSNDLPQASTQQSKKRAWSSPRLQVLGDITKLTHVSKPPSLSEGSTGGPSDGSNPLTPGP